MSKVEIEAGKKYILLVPQSEMDNYDSGDVFKDGSIIAVVATDGGKIVSAEDVSDGYHTFKELYHYRALYNALWLNSEQDFGQHKSRKHSDGKFCFDADGEWFVVVVNLPTGQVTNHYHADYWNLFDIPEREVAEKWDGHTPQEAAKRMEEYLGGF